MEPHEVKLSVKEELQVIYKLLKKEVPWKGVALYAIIASTVSYQVFQQEALYLLSIFVGVVAAAVAKLLIFIFSDLFKTLYVEKIKPKYRFYKELKQEEILNNVDNNFISKK